MNGGEVGGRTSRVVGGGGGVAVTVVGGGGGEAKRLQKCVGGEGG